MKTSLFIGVERMMLGVCKNGYYQRKHFENDMGRTNIRRISFTKSADSNQTSVYVKMDQN